MVGDTPPGLGDARRDDDGVRRPARRVRRRRSRRAIPCSQARRRPGRLGDAVRRQHGRQGNALRHRQLRAVGDGDHRRLERLGQLDARFVHAARRPGADVADAAGRGDLRRRRLGPVRHAHVRHRRGVRRRAHDRAHAGVPRQEDRSLRDEDGVDRDPDAAASWCCSVRRSRCWSSRARPASPIRARTASPRSSTRSPRPATTTAAPLPGCRPTRRSTTPRSASPCCSRATGSRSRCSPSPARWPRRRRFPPGLGTLPTHTPLFVVLLASTVVIVGALTFVPALALGPDRRASDAVRRPLMTRRDDPGVSMSTHTATHA